MCVHGPAHDPANPRSDPPPLLPTDASVCVRLSSKCLFFSGVVMAWGIGHMPRRRSSTLLEAGSVMPESVSPSVMPIAVCLAGYFH